MRRTFIPVLLLMLCILFPATGSDIYVNGEATAAVMGTFDEAAFDLDEDIIPTGSLTFDMESDSLTYWSTVGITEDGVDITLDRLSYQRNLSAHFQLTIGRQDLLSGYGYGWNPSDLYSGVKNPSDPDADRSGSDAVSLVYDDWNLFTGKVIVKLDDGSIGEDLDWADVSFGVQTSLLLPWIELQLSLKGDIPNKGSIVPSAGLAAFADIAGIGIYGEIDSDLDILGGFEYFFENGMSLIAEYFYHHDGYDLADRTDFFTDVFLDPTLAESYTPGHFARHYILGNLSYSFYEQNTDVILAALYSPDSSALMISPAVTVYTDIGLTVEGGYVGLFELQDAQFSEFGLYTFDHAVQLSCSYSF